MHTRHHIFNFHIGFWGALLISSVVTIQTGLLLLMTSGLTLAQTASFLTLEKPATDIQVLAGDPIELQATTQDQVIGPVNFRFTNQSTGAQNVIQGTSTDGLIWTGVFNTPTSPAIFSLAADVLDNQSIPHITQPAVTIEVVDNITINIPTPTQTTFLNTDTSGIIDGVTSLPADRLDIIFKDTAGVNDIRLQANPTSPDNQNWQVNFDPSTIPVGDYPIEAEAFLGGNLAGQENPGFSISITQAQATVDISAPGNGDTLVGPVTLVAQSSAVASELTFQITSPSNAILANTVAVSTDGVNWSADLDTTTIPNTTGQPYALSAFATIGGQIIPSNTISISVNNAPTVLPPTITTNVLPNGETGTPYAATVVAIQGTPPYTYDLSFGALPNGLTLNAQSGEIEGTPLVDGDFAITVRVTDSAGQSTTQDYQITITSPAAGNPLAILSFSIANTTVGVPTNWLVEGTGGTPPYTWSIVAGSLPDGMQSATTNDDLVISGTPTEAGSSTFTVELTDADGTEVQQSFTPNVAAPAVVNPPVNNNQQGNNQNANQPNNNQQPADDTTQADPVLATLVIDEPTNTETISGNQEIVRVTTSSRITPPTLSLVSSSGQNVLLGQPDKMSEPFGQSTGTKWVLTIDTTQFPNGDYALQASSRDPGTGRTITSSVVNVVIANGETLQAFSGSITAPGSGQTVAGNVPLVARLNGEVQSLMFVLTLPDGTTQREPGIPNSAGDFEALWNSAGIPGGTVTIKAEVIDNQGVTKGLNTVRINLRELRTSTTSNPDEIVDPRLVTDLQAGVSPEVPVECQLEQITDPSECTRFLDARRIDILNEREEEILREEQLPEVIARHIDLSDGQVTQKQQGKKIEDPLAGIIPVDKEEVEDRSLLVLSSTEPPAALKPFIQQTVPAVIIFDQDGDGLPDEMEERFGTNPQLADTDGDGFDDGTEIKNGFNPNGPGKLGEELAPVERAILNQKPLDQPRFAGAIDTENLQVAEVKSQEDSDGLLLAGKAEPNSVITLYIYSQLPIVVTTKTDAAGNWTYEMEDPLVDGKHEVYVAVTNEAGRIEKKSQPLSFFVDSALAVSEEEFLAAVTVEDTTSRFLLWYLLGGFMAISLGGFLFFFFFKNRVTIPE